MELNELTDQFHSGGGLSIHGSECDQDERPDNNGGGPTVGRHIDRAGYDNQATGQVHGGDQGTECQTMGREAFT